MSDFTWVLDPSKTEEETFISLANILNILGVKNVTMPERGQFEWPVEGNVFTLGNRGMVRYGHHYYPESMIGLSYPSARDLFPIHWLLNDQYFKCKLFDLPWNGEELFLKMAPGQYPDTIPFKAGVYGPNNLPKVDGSMWVEYDKVKAVSHEYRAFILNGEVVGSCWYATNGSMTIIPSVPQDVMDFFNKCAKHCPKTYVVDVARSEKGLSIIETNTFNSSGLMGIDLYQFATKVKAYLDVIEPIVYEPTVVLPYAESHEAALVRLGKLKAYDFSSAMKTLHRSSKVAQERAITNKPGTDSWFYYGAIVYPNKETARAKTKHWYNKESFNHEEK